MEEKNIGGLQCIVWYDNNKAEKLWWSNKRIIQTSFCWLEYKSNGLFWTYFYANICFWEFVILRTLSQKIQILNAWKDNLGNPVLLICYIFYLLLNLWKNFGSMSCFYTLDFPTIFGNWFFFYKFIMIYVYQQFDYLIPMEILIPSVPLKRPYSYNILTVLNNMLFLILTSNAFPAPLLLISDSSVSYRYKILGKCS